LLSMKLRVVACEPRLGCFKKLVTHNREGVFERRAAVFN